FAKAHPDRYFEMYIAEQQLVAAAVGLQVLGWRPFGSSFAAFFSRAYDFVRMAAISRANICLVGSHAGVSIGEDGPSQMALEDIAAFRAVHGSTVLHPCDANQTAKLVAAMAETDGIVFLRTLRPAAARREARTSSDAAFRQAGGGARVGGNRRRRHRRRGAPARPRHRARLAGLSLRRTARGRGSALAFHGSARGNASCERPLRYVS